MLRPQFWLRHLMIVVLGCVLFAGGFLVEGLGWLSIIAGPVCGALIQQEMGGRGIIGGILGGTISYLGFGVVMYATSRPGTTDLLGPQLALSLLTFLGALIGLIVGVLIWGLQITIQDKDTPYPWWPSAPVPSKPKAWIEEELPSP